MGTRHLITIVKDGEFKLAQYGQWDGYPSGQGAEIVTFFHEGDVEAFKANIDKLRYVDDAEADLLYQTLGIPAGQEWLNMEQSDAIKNTFPTLHRDTGSDILSIIASGQAELQDLSAGTSYIPTVNSLGFAGGFGCEWVYTLDLDKGTFEVYEGGFNEEGEPNRFTDIIKAEFEGSDEAPCAVRAVGEYKLDAMPTWQEFLADLDPAALQRKLAWIAEREAEEAAEAAKDPSEVTPSDDDADPEGDKPTWAQ